MKFYLMRHCEAEEGEQMDPVRTLTDTGKAQRAVIIDFLQTQTEKIGLVIHSDLARGVDTADKVATALGVDALATPLVGPNGDIKKVWKLIKQETAKLGADGEVLVISHGPFINIFTAWLLMSGEGDKFHVSHGTVMHFDTETPENGAYDYGGRAPSQPSYLHWMVTPKLLERYRKEDPRAVVEAAAVKLVDAMLLDMGVRVDEAAGDYYYDEVEEKRWVLGDGGQSGNCDPCTENADLGWLDMDAGYDSPGGVVDEPPAHPNCTCEIENRTRRVRVPV